MSNKTQSILIGGLGGGVLAVVLSIPQIQCIGCLVCLCYVGAGLLAVWHYTNTNTLTITGGQGVGIGALAGIVSGLVAGLLGLLFRALGVLPGIEEVMEQIEESGSFDQLDPETADMIYGIIEALFGIWGILFGVVIALLLGVIGGAIGAAVFKKGTGTPGTAESEAV